MLGNFLLQKAKLKFHARKFPYTEGNIFICVKEIFIANSSPFFTNEKLYVGRGLKKMKLSFNLKTFFSAIIAKKDKI